MTKLNFEFATLVAIGGAIFSYLVGPLNLPLEVLLIIMVYQLGRLMNQPVLRDFACLFYIANEGISILENFGEMGIPIPTWIGEKLLYLKNQPEEKKMK